uniref:Uncharacterized protein n=1 Tax=Meloidogyne enterolobii TaxID=390850 RepID=A0A6V7TYW4_MELEN|nr:unnamed protein product [Meloidogyne enterolobii]
MKTSQYSAVNNIQATISRMTIAEKIKRFIFILYFIYYFFLSRKNTIFYFLLINF